MATEWPLLGRDDELTELATAVGAGRSAVVVGGSGVGKTRLAEEAVARSGRSATWVVAVESAADIPLAALSTVVGGMTSGADLHEVLGRAAGVLEERIGEGVLVVDDAHHLDPASLTLLSQLVRHAGTTCVATVRTPPDPPAELVGWWKDDRAMRTTVAPFDHATTLDVARQLLGPDADPALLDKLWRLSRGNVLYLRELVLGARARGTAGGRIPLSALDDPTARLRELVGVRLGHLPPDQRAALATVAAAEPLPLSLAEALVGAEPLLALERAGLVRVDGDQVRPAHPVHGEVARADTAPLERRSILRAVMAAVADGDGVDPLVLATWQLEAEGEAEVGLLIDAAWEAFHRFNNPLAERLARAAFRDGDPEAGLVLVEPLMGLGRADEVDEVLDGLDVADRPKLAARRLVARAGNRFWQRGDPEGALEVLVQGEGDLAAHPTLVAELAAHRAQLLLVLGRFEEARAVGGPVLTDGASTPEAQVRAALALAPSWAAAGRLDELVDAVADWLDVLDALPVAIPMAETVLRVSRQLALTWAGRALEAEAAARDEIELRLDEVPVGLAAILVGLRGRAAYGRGRLPQARALLAEAAELMAIDDWFALRPWVLAFVARCEALQGDPAAARRTLAEGRAAVVGVGLHAMGASFAEVDLELSMAWVAAVEGATTEAIDQACEVASTARSDVLPLALDALHLVVRLGRPEAVLDELRSLAAEVQGPLARLVVRHAEAAIAADVEALADVAEDADRLGLALLATEAWEAASVAATTAGAMARSEALAARARTRRQELDVGPPPVSAAATPPSDLTTRELEVAVLAAGGASAPDIADRLFISARTVHTHLQRAYRKLGVHDRSALADALGLPG